MKTITEQVIDIVAQELCADKNKVTLETNFLKDFGSDSLNQIRVMIGLEEKFNLRIPDEDEIKILTVQDAVNYVTERTTASV
jgi:acyl carrier protein